MDHIHQQWRESFKRGAWVAHVLDKNIRLDGSTGPTHHDALRFFVRLDDPNGLHTYWPSRYPDGIINFDCDAPRDAQRAVKAAFKWIDKELRGHNERIRN